MLQNRLYDRAFTEIWRAYVGIDIDLIFDPPVIDVHYSLPLGDGNMTTCITSAEVKGNFEVTFHFHN